MARPKCERRVSDLPLSSYFKPRGIQTTPREDILLSIDELEALKLADLHGFYQERAAEQMNVSRQTFGRILESAHWKVAHALIDGHALRIEGGPVQVEPARRFACRECGHSWKASSGGGRPDECPSCMGHEIGRAYCEQHRSDKGPRCGRGHHHCCQKSDEQTSKKGENQ